MTTLSSKICADTELCYNYIELHDVHDVNITIILATQDSEKHLSIIFTVPGTLNTFKINQCHDFAILESSAHILIVITRQNQRML